MSPSSITDQRGEWELILQKMASGEMPPAGMPKPVPADVAAVNAFIREQFVAADASTVPSTPTRFATCSAFRLMPRMISLPTTPDTALTTSATF